MDRVPHNPQHILCVGRLSQEKGHFVLIDSLAALCERGCSFTCTLVGEGPLRPLIEDRLADRGLQETVTLTGSLPSDQVLRLYKEADIVVSASFSEGIPVVLMEAMAAGLPVVATRVGGVPELLHHGQSGLLVAPGDALELADAIQWVLENPGPSCSLGNSASQFVRQEFCLDTAADRLVTLFEQAIESRKQNKRL
jgi:colanic acid/amylovoran biosynthesis glycosyltransferase